MTDISVLSRRIEDGILATAGVRAVYRAGSLVANLVDAGATALRLRETSEPVVSVSMDDERVTVEASIGVDDTAPARETLIEVRGAVERTLAADGLALDRIAVTIAYVQARESS